MGKNLKIFLWFSFAVMCVLEMTGMVDIISGIEGLLGGGLAIATAGVTTGGIMDGGATLEKAHEQDPDYTEIDWNKKLTLIAPSSTPIDTITRNIGNTRSTESIETGGWEIGVRENVDKVHSNVSAKTDGSVSTIVVDKIGIWNEDDTLMVIEGGVPYYFHVNSRDLANNSISVTSYGYESGKFPALTADSEIFRLGKAMNETDAQTTPVATTPTNRTNYCQIHMCQIEESVVHAMHKKQVAYDFATMKEQAIWEFKREMEYTNIFGKKASFLNAEGKRVYTSDGLWNLIENRHDIDFTTAATTSDWVSLTKAIFDANNGSERRIALIGSDLMEYWSNVDAFTKQLDPTNVEVVFGVKFNKIITNFGELLVKAAPNSFVGHFSGAGIVIDPSYIRKDVFESLNTTTLEFDKTGQKRVNAQRLLENYCLIVENQPVHHKLFGSRSTTSGGSSSNA